MAAQMSRHSPRSEGKCAIYGREAPNEIMLTNNYRARLHNEHTGMPKTDISGANTSVSLLWNPVSKHQDAYMQASHRRRSQLKQVQDFGISRAPATVDVEPPLPSPRALANQSRRAPVPMPAPLTNRPFLDGESARLKACAHARNIGQTFLTSGNLAQAKAYLARAEQILSVDEKHLRGRSPQDILDEFMSARKDSYS